MIQSGTSVEFETFPSTAEDRMRSIQTSVSLEAETEETGDLPQTFVEFNSDFRIADGQSISGLFVSASGYLDDDSLRDEVEGSLADLNHFKRMVDEWYDDTYRALREVEVEILNNTLTPSEKFFGAATPRGFFQIVNAG